MSTTVDNMNTSFGGKNFDNFFSAAELFSRTLVHLNTKLWMRCTLLGVMEKEKAVTFVVNAQVHLALSTKICSLALAFAHLASLSDRCLLTGTMTNVVMYVCRNCTCFGRWPSFGCGRTCRWFRRRVDFFSCGLLLSFYQPNCNKSLKSMSCMAHSATRQRYKSHAFTTAKSAARPSVKTEST